MTNETTIILAPGLGVSAAELVAAWNAGPGKAGHAPARVEHGTAEQYDLAEVGFMVVSSIATGLLTNMIYDLVKGVFAEKHRPPPAVRITITPQPDGSTVVVVTMENEQAT